MKLLTVEAVAEMLSMAKSTVYALVSSGALPSFRLGPNRGGIRVSEQDLLAYLESSRSDVRQDTQNRTRPKRIKSRHFEL